MKNVIIKCIALLIMSLISLLFVKYISFAFSLKINVCLNINQDFLDNNPVHCIIKLKEDTNKKYDETIQKIGLDSYNFYISKCTPFMEITFHNYYEYISNKNALVKGLNSKYVDSAFIYNEYQSNATINDTTYTNPYCLSDAFADIGVDNTLYIGDGIKVGIIDGGVPDVTTNFSNSIMHLYGNNVLEHATVIASIIGGSSGIAPDVEFYCYSCAYDDGIGFLEGCEELVCIQKVNIVVICMDSSYIFYNLQCQYIDYLIREKNCTFVLSAGNRGLDDAAIVSPNSALNAITVGSVDANKNISCFSSWDVGQEQMSKPEVVAPGGQLTNIPNINNTYSGTSYSAPMVAGVLALLMEENESLKTNSVLAKAIIEIGCTKLPTQTSYFDAQAGFGLVNYTNSRNIMNNNQYTFFTINGNHNIGDIIDSIALNLPSNNGVSIITTTNAPAVDIIHYNGDLLDVYNGYFNNSVTYEYSKYLIKLLDLNNQVLSISTSNTNNNYLVYSNSTSYARNISIKIILNSIKANSYSHDPYAPHTPNIHEIGSLAYSLFEHYHNYTYIWNNYIRHRCLCTCGTIYFDAHVVSQNAFANGQTYAQCLLCGGLATNGNIPFNMYNVINYITNNGSYMLPNGTIVIANEDLYLLQDRSIYNSINTNYLGES